MGDTKNIEYSKQRAQIVLEFNSKRMIKTLAEHGCRRRPPAPIRIFVVIGHVPPRPFSLLITIALIKYMFNCLVTMDFTKPWRNVETAMHDAFGRGWAAVSLRPLAGGHAGAVYLLEARDASGNDKRFVLKCAPPGVTNRGAADVCRPAPLLGALRRAGFPAARVAWSDPEGACLGVAHIAFEWVDGQHNFPLSKAEEEPQILPDALWLDAVGLLARLHAVDWRRDLLNWSNPASLTDDVARWRPTYLKAPEKAWIASAEAAEAALLRTAPETGEACILHGDYQTSNLMIRDGAIEAVIDWDLATVGDPLLDLGWLMMWADQKNWKSGWRSRCRLGAGALTDAYFAARGISPRPTRWHHAFACYKFASITCLNVRLHRSGRRIDGTWELFALDVVPLFTRARELTRHTS